MPRISIDIPKSKPAAEEADWYATPQGRRETQREFARALKDATLVRSTGSKIGKTDPNMLQQLMEQANDPAVRLASAEDSAVVGDWPRRIAAGAPMQPWPYGMLSSINPFVIFVGPSPGNSPPVGDPIHQTCSPYDLPTAGVAHGGLYVHDTRNYWSRVRELGSMIVHAHAPAISDRQTHALIGQLNLGTGQIGQARNAPLELEYCRWVPEVILDCLRPSYVIMLGLRSLLAQSGLCFDPSDRLHIDWNRPDECVAVQFPDLEPEETGRRTNTICHVAPASQPGAHD